MSRELDQMVTAVGCTRCGTTLAPGQRFCAACGAAVPTPCASCGVALAPDARFCPECGAAAGTRAGSSDPNLRRSPAHAGGEPGGQADKGIAFAGPWGRVAAHLQDAVRGEFVIEREIGRGGMAAVFLAHEVRLNRRVALKVMSPALLTGHGMVERFRQEAVTVANLSHANIVTVHAVREVDELYFFVMKFVEGRSLDVVLRERGRLPVAVVQAILFQVGSALTYAHRRGVVHRDVKPANILIDHDGRAIVTDFGIAKVAESSALTQTGMLIGTPVYMSPEQCLGHSVSAASDQYSLGIVAYQLLTGHPPFTGASFTVLAQHISDPVPPLDHAALGFPPETAAAIERMLAKEPGDRWPSVSQAVAALGGTPVFEDDPLWEELASLATAPPPPPAPPPPTPAIVRLTLPDAVAQPPAGAAQGDGMDVDVDADVARVAQLEVGDVVTATVAVIDQYGEPMTDVPVAWTCAPPERLVVDPASLRVEARTSGRALLRASAGDAFDEATAEVTEPRPASLTVLPPDRPLREAEEWQPVVTVRDRRGRRMEAEVRLESSAPEVLAVRPDGRVEGLRAGHAELRGTVGGLTHALPLEVLRASVTAVEIAPLTGALVVGDAVTVTASALDRRGRSIPGVAVAWHSGDPRVARVDADGLLRGCAQGSTELRATAEGHEATVHVHVRRAPVAAIVVQAPTPLLPDETRALHAELRDARGELLTRDVQWSSANPAVVEVSRTGVLTARTPGMAVVTARSEGHATSVEVAVLVHSVTEMYGPAVAPSLVSTAELPPSAVAPAGLVSADVAPPAVAAPIVVAPPAPSTPATVPAAASVPAPSPARRRSLAVPVGVALLIAVAAGGWLLSRPGTTPDVADSPAASPVAAATGPAPADAPTPTPPALEAAPQTAPATAPATAPEAAPPVAPAARPSPPRSEPEPPRTRPAAGASERAQPTAETQPVSPPPPVAVAATPAVPPRPAPVGTSPMTLPPRADTEAPDAIAEARGGMQRALAAYVQGVGARSIGDMTRVFPAMSANVRRNWEALFRLVPSIDAQAGDVELQPTGGETGTARLALSVSFANPASRRPCTQVTQLRLSLARTGATWRIVEMTQTGSSASAGCSG
ncbi:MAG: protein kinase domain-containing protein [Gemmatirosa sp.]